MKLVFALCALMAVAYAQTTTYYRINGKWYVFDRNTGKITPSSGPSGQTSSYTGPSQPSQPQQPAKPGAQADASPDFRGQVKYWRSPQGRQCQCGVPATGTRIVGGKDADKSRQPWMAGLMSRNYFASCGASMINDRWILTAAHCVIEKKASDMLVALGAYTRSEMRNPGIAHQVEKIVMHPSYDPKTLVNDIALVKLSASAPGFGTKLIPVCLNKKIEEHKQNGLYTNLRLTGWGLTNAQDNGGDVAQTLQEIDFKEVDANTCTREWGRSFNSSMHVCAGGMRNWHDSCQGDSGGPMTTDITVQGKKAAVQVGVVSFGTSDCSVRSTKPGIYSKVPGYHNWIMSQVADGTQWCAGGEL